MKDAESDLRVGSQQPRVAVVTSRTTAELEVTASPTDTVEQC